MDKAINNRFEKLAAKVRALELKIDGPRENDQESVSNEHNAKAKSDEAPRQSAVVVETPKNTNATKKKSGQSFPWWRSFGWWNFIKRVGMVAGIGYAVVTYLQWRDLRYNFETDQRAWVSLQCTWPPEIVSVYQRHATIGITTDLINVGKSAIKHISARAVFELVDADNAPSFDVSGFHSTQESYAVFPTQSIPFDIDLYDQKSLSSRPLTETEFNQIRSGKLYVAIFGYVMYEDQFGFHWFRFCNWRSYSASRTNFHARECVAFNEIGDGFDTLKIKGLER